MIKALILFSTAFLLIGCASTPSNSGAAIEGYCPVCYLTENKAVKGSPEFSATHDGKTYNFTNRETLAAFEEDPEKYLPAYDGWCAYGMTFGQKVEVDPKVFSVVDGKLYLNKNRWIGRTFDKKQAEYIVKADQEWVKLEP
jgi:YHS domain-containing protein